MAPLLWTIALVRLMAAAALLLLPAGCESERQRVQETEQMLIAAGFHAEPADSPEKEAQLRALPPHQFLAQPIEVGGRRTTGYVYADPDGCHCVFVGDEKAFQAFHQLAIQKKIADEYLAAAQLSESAAFNWAMWGPFWPPPVIVVPQPVARGRR
jgi:hypothetical protein